MIFVLWFQHYERTSIYNCELWEFLFQNWFLHKTTIISNNMDYLISSYLLYHEGMSFPYWKFTKIISQFMVQLSQLNWGRIIIKYPLKDIFLQHCFYANLLWALHKNLFSCTVHVIGPWNLFQNTVLIISVWDSIISYQLVSTCCFTGTITNWLAVMEYLCNLNPLS